jgi:hypothetical protein
MKKIWNRFTAWLSGWPESKEIYHFEEEEKKKPKKKTEIMN